MTMSSEAQKSASALMICGDYMEDYEVMVPYSVLQAFGIRVDCVSPGKRRGDKCLTAVHDFMGFELYTEIPGHLFRLNSTFENITPESYDVLIIPGGRFVEPLSIDDNIISILHIFAKAAKPIVTSCHSQLLLVAAGLLKGKKCTAFASMKPVIELAGGIWWEQPGIQSVLDITACVKDGNIVSSIGWPAHGEYLNVLLHSMGAKITKAREVAVLFLCGDYVEDYEMNIPFRALQCLGCKVDVVSPNKKKGDICVSAIYVEDTDQGTHQVYGEKRGHNIYLTANWSDINVDDYDCIVVPGGRSPELLVMAEKAVSVVNKFMEKDKVIAATGHGQWLLAAAGALKGKKCASCDGMKVISKMAGGELVESSTGCVIDGKLVTATGWHVLPAFVFELSGFLGFSVVF